MTELVSDLAPDFSKEESTTLNKAGAQKFGTFVGVFVPSLLMLFGVIIFLRLGWIVGLAGLPTTLTIISLASLIALITVLSMSAIATNIEVKAGGVYYIISRSLGAEVGSAIGLPLYLKQSLTIAFCVIGFAESLKDLIPSWNMTHIGLGTLGILTILAYTSVQGAMKVQLVIFVAIIASLASLFAGDTVTPIHPDSYIPEPVYSLGFWAIFAIFFPAMTGVESSASLSGDLRNPSKSLPLGTISAILVGFTAYICIATFLFYKVPANRLVNDPLIMQDLAFIPSLIVVGIWGTTLSSALGGLIASPRTLKAMADDNMAPKIFSKVFGPMEEPRIATLATCAVAFLGVYFGSVNVIAPLLTMITLICYAVLNLSAGIETLIANPSWRPRVRIHWAISILGAILSIISMLMIDSGYALISLLFVSLLYLAFKKKAMQVSWTDIQQGILLFFSRSIIHRLSCGEKAAKSWRPHFLIFTKFCENYSTPLLKFSEAISQGKGFLTMASFVPKGTLSYQKQRDMEATMSNCIQKHNIQSFVKVNEAESITSGMQQMIAYYGLGPLKPNTLLFGGLKKENKFKNFLDVMQSAISRHFNIVVMNEHSEMLEEECKLKKDIHLWWDNYSQDNSDLMLVFAYMLQQNKNTKTSRIFVKAIVDNELQKKAKYEELQKLSLERRLPMNIEVYISSSNIDERLALVQEFSKEAEVVLMSFTPPAANKPTEEYTHYLNSLYQAMDKLPSLVLTLSSEHTPLNAIFE